MTPHSVAHKVTHLVCDCDGVLVDSEAVADKAMVAALHQALVAAAAQEKAAMEAGITLDGVARAVAARLGQTMETVIASVAEHFSVRLNVAVADEVRLAVEAAVRQQQTAMPGVASALQALAADGLPLAVASNSTLPRVREALAVCGVTGLMGERIYTGERVPRPKPAPDVYLAACAGWPAAPEDCAAVEDSVTGVTAARGAGLQVIGFAGGTHLHDAAAHAHRLRAVGASWVFDDMSKLVPILAALRAGRPPSPDDLMD